LTIQGHTIDSFKTQTGRDTQVGKRFNGCQSPSNAGRKSVRWFLVRFYVLQAGNIKNMVLWLTTQCSFVRMYCTSG